MRSYLSLGLVSLLTAATASAYNETLKTVTVTSYSTINLCPAPVTTTITLCDAQCATSTPNTAANIVYETISDYQAGQVVRIGDAVTTLAQPTTLTLQETVSGLALIPGAATDINDYTASVTIDSTIYPSSMTAYSGEVVTCQTGTTIISSDGVVLTNCPCTVQSTILEVTATGNDALPTAVAPSPNYIVKIIYVYSIEYTTDSIPTRVTSTATSTLTTIETETTTETATTTATAPNTPRPSMATVDRVVFMLEFDTTVDGSTAGNALLKRQAGSLPGISVDLYACLSQCAAEQDCVALTLNKSSSVCRPLVQFEASSSRNAPGEVVAIVIFRPTVPSSAGTSSSSTASFSSRSVSSSSSTKSPPVTRSGVTPSPSTTTASGSASIPGPSIPSSISVSSNKPGSKSVLYPISDSSAISTTSSLSSISSSSLDVKFDFQLKLKLRFNLKHHFGRNELFEHDHKLKLEDKLECYSARQQFVNIDHNFFNAAANFHRWLLLGQSCSGSVH
ncbi:hypothetical protein KCU65_g8491, partial [Aureobasidium melanogenum]